VPRIDLTTDAELASFGRDLGAGTVLPTVAADGSALRRGDAYQHTNWGLHFWTGSAWRQRGPHELTAAQRTALVTTGLYAGFQVFETDTQRRWSWSGTAWRYIGGAPPPTYPCTVLAGFAAFASLIPVAFQDASGTCHLQGIVQVTTAFSTATPILQLPSQVPVPVGAGEGFPLMVHNNAGGLTLIRVSIDGQGKLNFAEGVAVAAGSYIYLLGTSWHPTSPGTTGLA